MLYTKKNSMHTQHEVDNSMSMLKISPYIYYTYMLCLKIKRRSRTQ